MVVSEKLDEYVEMDHLYVGISTIFLTNSVHIMDNVKKYPPL